MQWKSNYYIIIWGSLLYNIDTCTLYQQVHVLYVLHISYLYICITSVKEGKLKVLRPSFWQNQHDLVRCNFRINIWGFFLFCCCCCCCWFVVGFFVFCFCFVLFCFVFFFWGGGGLSCDTNCLTVGLHKDTTEVPKNVQKSKSGKGCFQPN